MRYIFLLRNAALRTIITMLLLGAVGFANRVWAQISITDQASLTRALQTEGSHILAADVELGSGEIYATTTCTITGNGSYKISRAANATNTGIKITADGITLAFVNVVFDGERVVQQTADDDTAMLRNGQPNSTLVLDGCTIPDSFDTENDASMGGSRLITSANVILTNCTIGSQGAGNNAELGGGIYVESGAVEINLENTSSSANSSKIEYNIATTDGGGIYITSGAGVLLNGTNAAAGEGVCIRYNQANTHGGGVYKQGTLEVKGLVKVVENKSKADKIIVVSASPSNGGTVSGGGTFEHGSSCTVTATANSGFVFTGWTENGIVVSTEAEYTFNVTANRNLVAQFEKLYHVTLTANPAHGGTVVGDGWYENGESCTISAYANEDFKFLYWTENGTVVSTDATFNFDINGADRNLVANFEPVCTVLFYLGGTTIYEKEYGDWECCDDDGNDVWVTWWEPYEEDGWMDSKLRVTARKGSSVESEDLTCDYGDAEYERQYAQGTTVTLEYINGNPSDYDNYHYYNAYYYDELDGERLIPLTYNSATDSYSFEVDCVPYSITARANPPHGGMVSGVGSYVKGTRVTMGATALRGFKFLNWTENGSVVSPDANYTFTVSGDRDLVAHFEALPAYTITATANPVAGGTVSGGGTYYLAESCTVTATAPLGYEFVNWTENGSVVSFANPYIFTVTANRNLVANFRTVPTYTVTATVNPPGSGLVTGDTGTFNDGTQVSLTARDSESFRFVNWTENGSEVETNRTISFHVHANHNLVANFEEVCSITFYIEDYGDPEYCKCPNSSIMITANGQPEGTLTMGSGDVNNENDYESGCYTEREFEFRPGTEVKVTFTPATQSSEWSRPTIGAIYTYGGYSIFSAYRPTSNFSETFVVDCTPFTITATANPAAGGTVRGGGTFVNGNGCTLSATANLGYKFVKWTKNGTQVSSNPNYSFTVTEDATYVAHFQTVPIYTITASPSSTAYGSVSGGGQFTKGTTCTLKAYGNGYAFDYWTLNGTPITGDWTITFTVIEDATYVAHYKEIPGTIPYEFSTPLGKLYFSQGNLQYMASTDTWRFAERQYDYVGDGNNYISQNYNGWIDLFGWGTGDNPTLTLAGVTAYAHFDDWGDNPISNGGNTPNLWRTLSSYEWAYVIYYRQTPSGIKFAKATVNGVAGLILLPDNWSSSYYSLSNTNSGRAPFSSNEISSSTWANSLEAHGAVFLPAAGNRHVPGSAVGIGSQGYYWSSTFIYDLSNSAYGIFFRYDELYETYIGGMRNLSDGRSVRLVRPAGN